MEKEFNIVEAVNNSVPCEDFVGPDEEGYSNAAYYATKMLIKCSANEPERFFEEAEKFRNNPYSDAFLSMSPDGDKTLDELLMQGRYGLTGFQWGYAIHTALWMMGQPPAPNPALLTIRGGE